MACGKDVLVKLDSARGALGRTREAFRLRSGIDHQVADGSERRLQIAPAYPQAWDNMDGIGVCFRTSSAVHDPLEPPSELVTSPQTTSPIPFWLSPSSGTLDAYLHGSGSLLYHSW